MRSFSTQNLYISCTDESQISLSEKNWFVSMNEDGNDINMLLFPELFHEVLLDKSADRKSDLNERQFFDLGEKDKNLHQ